MEHEQKKETQVLTLRVPGVFHLWQKGLHSPDLNQRKRSKKNVANQLTEPSSFVWIEACAGTSEGQKADALLAKNRTSWVEHHCTFHYQADTSASLCC